VKAEKLRDPTGAAAVLGLAKEVGAVAGMIREHGVAWPVVEDDVNEWVARALAARNEILRMTPEF
jgi:hypothetical protein